MRIPDTEHGILWYIMLHLTSPLVNTNTTTAFPSATNTFPESCQQSWILQKIKSITHACSRIEILNLTFRLSQNVDHKFKFHSKKGQLPFIELNGQQIGDSTTIIKELSQKFDKDIDAGLTKEQKNISHAMISMVENHLTFVILSWRAKNPGEMINGYKINFQQSLGSKIPNAILSFFFKLNYGHRVRNIVMWKSESE
jgi:Glutathione S-transferase N-terminal domain